MKLLEHFEIKSFGHFKMAYRHAKENSSALSTIIQHLFFLSRTSMYNRLMYLQLKYEIEFNRKENLLTIQIDASC